MKNSVKNKKVLVFGSSGTCHVSSSNQIRYLTLKSEPLGRVIEGQALLNLVTSVAAAAAAEGPTSQDRLDNRLLSKRNQKMAGSVFRVINVRDDFSNKTGGDWLQRKQSVDPLKALQDSIRPEPFSYTAIVDRFLESKKPDNNIELQEVYAFRWHQEWFKECLSLEGL